MHDAQGREILVQAIMDVKVHLLDQSGKLVVLLARVAISPHVSQPVLCKERLLEAGWGINPTEHTLTHAAGACVPIEFHNIPVTVKGWIKVIFSGNTQVKSLQLSCPYVLHCTCRCNS